MRLSKVLKMYTINYDVFTHNHFSQEEFILVKKWIDENLEELELHKGLNLSVDVTPAIGRTANVDVEVY